MDNARLRLSWRSCFQHALLLGILAIAIRGHAQSTTPTSIDSIGRIEQLERVVADLQSEIGLLRLQNTELLENSDLGMMQDSTLGSCECCSLAGCDGCGVNRGRGQSHFVTYDNGWVIRPRDPARSPFELRFNVHNQFRYTGFANSVDSFVDSAGNTVPVNPRNDFDINRGRFVFSGYVFDPKLEFYTNIDYNTVATNPMLLLLSWIGYRFSDAFVLRTGLVKVPGTWEWQETSRFTLGAERSMATTFFRPSITAGIWADGEVGDSVFYHALIGDGFNTFTLRASELDTNLAYSALVWWEPRDSFGPGFSDLECHETLSIRMGSGFTYASNDSDQTGEPGPEQTVIRLSDGTRLVEPGALAPGVTVNEFDITLYSLHLGLKRRGLSFAGEYFFRSLTSINGNGPIPDDSIFDHGFFAQGGMFVVPQRLELYTIGSRVVGDFGNATEVGGGVNWYVQGQRGARFTFDVVHIDESPAQQDRTGLIAGGTGTLFRTQWWHFF